MNEHSRAWPMQESFVITDVVEWFIAWESFNINGCLLKTSTVSENFTTHLVGKVF